MAKKTVKEHTKAEILRRVMDGEKIYKIAEEFDFSIQAIYMWIRDTKGSKTKDIIIRDRPAFEPITEDEIKHFIKSRSSMNIMLGYNTIVTHSDRFNSAQVKDEYIMNPSGRVRRGGTI